MASDATDMRPRRCLRCWLARADDCAHLDRQCEAAASLLWRACAARHAPQEDERATEDAVRRVGVSIGFLSDMWQYLFQTDPEQRFDRTEEELVHLDREVPSELVPVLIMRTGAPAPCWSCKQDATVLHVSCAGRACARVAHPACMGFASPSRPATDELLFFCPDHTDLKEPTDQLPAAPGDPPCVLCKLGAAARDRVGCSRCAATWHIQCMPMAFRNESSTVEDLRTRAVFCCKRHAMPTFVGAPLDPEANYGGLGFPGWESDDDGT